MSRKGTFVGKQRVQPPSIKPVYTPPQDLYMAATKNEFYWPIHWRRVIHKIEMLHEPATGRRPIRVTPRNPDFAKYLEAENWTSTDAEEGRIPPMYLDRVEFETIEEMDAWATVCSRIDN